MEATRDAAGEAAPVVEAEAEAEAGVVAGDDEGEAAPVVEAESEAGAAASDDEGGVEDEGSAVVAEGAEAPALKSKAESRRERRARKKSGRG